MGDVFSTIRTSDLLDRYINRKKRLAHKSSLLQLQPAILEIT